MSRPRLHVIIASTRPGRIGPSIATWFEGVAQDQGSFDVDVVDLKEVDLPNFNEPNHPMMQEYTFEKTQKWAASVARADAFVFVMPEYNHSFNAAIKNAIDYLRREWNYKPVAFVSYGGVSAGTRAVQSIKPVLTALGMFPLADQVAIAGPHQFLDEHGVFEPATALDDVAKTMLVELARWTQAMKSLRA
jgi:NAD(P)H-dependent FMN reductase